MQEEDRLPAEHRAALAEDPEAGGYSHHLRVAVLPEEDRPEDVLLPEGERMTMGEHRRPENDPHPEAAGTMNLHARPDPLSVQGETAGAAEVHDLDRRSVPADRP